MTYQEIEKKLLEAIAEASRQVCNGSTGGDVLALCECLPLLREHFTERDDVEG